MNKKHHDSLASLNDISIKFETLWQQLPPETAALAAEFRAFSRGRQIKNVRQLLRVVMLYCGLDYSLRTTSGVLANLGTVISDQGVSDRLKGCVPWLRALLQLMLPKAPPEVAGQIGSVIRRLLVIDGTSVQCPAAEKTDYRLHLAWDWVTQSIVQIEVTDYRTGESLTLYKLEAGDVALADRGYSKEKSVSYVLDRGAEVIVRLAPSMLPLVDEAGKAIDLTKELKPGLGQLSRPVVMKSDGHKRVLYLHCFELPPEQAAEARRRRRRREQKTGHKMRQSTLIYTGWTMILTSFKPEVMSAQMIGQLYRLRWQIEIVIKRMKSVLRLDQLRAGRGSQLAEAYLLGKCVYILLVEKLADRLLKGAEEIAWRMWWLVQEQVRPAINEPMKWKWSPQTLKKLRERPRKRVRQYEKLSYLLMV